MCQENYLLNTKIYLQGFKNCFIVQLRTYILKLNTFTREMSQIYSSGSKKLPLSLLWMWKVSDRGTVIYVCSLPTPKICTAVALASWIHYWKVMGIPFCGSI